MPSPVDSHERDELVDKTVLLLCAVALNALEFFIPRLPFFPWLKPGLANIITMIWIIRYGTTDALVYSLVRSWIAGCYFGFSLVSLSLALSGGVLSTLVMGALWTLLGKRGIMGCVGIGVAGALFHNLGQLFAVYALLATNSRLFYQFPVMAAASALFGGGVGALVLPVIRIFDARATAGRNATFTPAATAAVATVRERLVALGIICLSFSLVFVTSTAALGIVAVLAALWTLSTHRWKGLMLFVPLKRFWALFLFIALIYLVFPYGTRFERLSFLTHESVTSTLQQWLRLYTWLELSFVLMKFRFHVVLFAALSKIFRRQQITLSAGLLAFEHFPLVAQTGKKRGRGFFWRLIRHPAKSAGEAIGVLYDEMAERVGGAGRQGPPSKQT
ncbi:MAG: Gx transporter family protein [Chitinispirillaceae bacterium]|nr:Gx transporter family protein [Chitinispirillaceae bacterium]